MIKVQPATSRIVKTETADRLTLVSPPGGSPVGNLMTLFGILGIVGAVGLAFTPALQEIGYLPVVTGVLLIPGAVFLLSGQIVSRRTWTMERTAALVSFTRKGLGGTTARKWPAEDVSSLWVEELRAPREATRYVLRIGFRNGRSEDVLIDTSGEEVGWIAAVMKDPRGERRQTPGTARAAAEPVIRRADPSVVPASIVSRRSEAGVELTFLPLINYKGRWWKLLGWVLAWLVLILVAGTLMGPRVARPITATAVVILLSVTFVRFMTLNRSSVIFVDAGLVTIAQNQQQGNHQLPVESIEFVQTFRHSNASELQFLIRGKPKVRILYGRPSEELEWAARFLRVALKHRPAEPEAAMSVDAAAGECQVCSEKMESRVVYCGKCRTPHHEECWSYVGQCSTYGCREIRFTRT